MTNFYILVNAAWPAGSTLSVSHVIGDGSLILQSGFGQYFGTPTTTNPLRVVAQSQSVPANYTIYKITGVVVDTLVIGGVLEGTTDQNFNLTDCLVQPRVTAGTYTDIETAVNNLENTVIYSSAIGTTVQAYSANLSTISGLTPTKGNILVGTGSSWAALGVGTNTYLLTADSTQTNGIKWGIPPAGTVTSITTGSGLSGGTITVSGTIALATISNNTILANTTGSTGVPISSSLTNILDIAGSTRGSLLYRGASGWAILTPGSNGYVLTSNGVGADPSYQAVGGTGTVTSVGIAVPTGFGTSGTNPITGSGTITITTSLSGIIKGTGTGLAAATAGTDYQAPISLTTTGTSGAATFISNTLNIPQYAGTTYTASTGLTLTGSAFSITNTAVTASSYGSSTSIPSFTVNAQGQLTAAAGNAVVAPAGTLSGTTLNSTVITSSLTSLGTLANLTVTNPIAGSITGNSATVTTNANLTGAVTSVGNTTTFGSIAAYSILANETSSSAAPTANTVLTLGVPGFTATAGTVAGQLTGSTNNYYQISLQNSSSGSSASTDFIATANNGNDSTHYADFGINSSAGATAPFTSANAAYLYSTDAELDIGALATGGVVNVYTTGTTSAPVLAATFTATQGLTVVGSISGSNLSGTNTGDQTITLTSDVTGSGTGSFATTIGSNKVTYAKMQQASTHTLLGNSTGGTANVQEITLGSGLSFSGTTIVASGGSGTVTSVTFTGDGTVLSSTPSSAVTTSGTVTAALANAAAYTVLGNFTGSSAAPTYSYALIGSQSISTATTLTASSPCVNTITAAGTAVTLPVASTCLGKQLLFYISTGSATTCSVSRQGSDTIAVRGSTITIANLNNGTSLLLEATASGTWQLLNIAPFDVALQTPPSLTQGALLYNNSNTSLTMALTAQGTAGQLWQSNGSSAPTATSTPGSGTALTSVTNTKNISAGTSPTAAVISGGASTTIGFTGTAHDESMQVTITEGTTSATGGVFSITYGNSAYSSTPNVSISPANANAAAAMSLTYISTQSTTGFQFTIGSSMPNGNIYLFNFIVKQ